MEGGEVEREERRAEEELYHRATLALQTVSSQETERMRWGTHSNRFIHNWTQWQNSVSEIANLHAVWNTLPLSRDSQRIVPELSGMYWRSKMHTHHSNPHTVDQEIFILKKIGQKIFVLINFRGLFNLWNFFNGGRLHNGWALGVFLEFSLLPGIRRASYGWL